MSEQLESEVLKQLQERFEAFDVLVHAQPWNQKMLDAYVALRDAIKQPLEEQAARRVLGQLDFQFCQRLQTAYNIALVKYEYDIVQKCSGQISWEEFLRFPEFLYIPDFLRLSLVEFIHVGFAIHDQGDSTILFVGGGSFPLTPISFMLLHAALRSGKLERITELLNDALAPEGTRELREILAGLVENGLLGALRIKVLDRDPHSISAARRFIDGLGLASHIIYSQEDIAHHTLDSTLRAVVFAASVPDKKHIIPDLLGQLKGTRPIRFVFRTVPEWSLRSLLYEPLPPELLAEIGERFPGFCELERTEPDPSGLITTTTVSAEYVACAEYRDRNNI